MSKIYVPNLSSNNCVVVQDHDTIRVYDNEPISGIEVNYVDYYVNSHYLSKSGSIIYGDSSFLDSCISSDNLTTNFYYRNDMDSIMIIFVVLALICVYLPYKIYSRMFGRWLKV